MEKVQHLVRLVGPKVRAGKPSPEAIGRVLVLVEKAVQGAINMGFRYKSNFRGRQPDWFVRASDIRFVDVSAGQGDSTILHFEAPRFGEAAGDIYEQGQLFEVFPKEADTGFDLFGDVLFDIQKKAENSLLFDANLLGRIGKFQRIHKSGIDSIFIEGDRLSGDIPPSLTEEISQLAKDLSSSTPATQRARIAGKLDMIRDSDNCFELLLEDKGTKVDGIWENEEIENLKDFFKKDVVVEGEAIFRVSGSLLRIEAQSMRLASQTDSFFKRIPRPMTKSTEQRSFLDPQVVNTGANAIFDKWPGDESEEEILAALKDMG